jgi:hypothetical protein
MRKKITIALLGTVAALTLGSIAWAAIPNASGVISGCYNKTSGALRVTDPQAKSPAACSAKETSLEWNEQGLKGDQGEPGPSHAWAGTPAGDAEFITSPANYGTQVGHLNIAGCAGCPKHAYLFLAKLTATPEFDDLNVAPTPVHCRLQVQDGTGNSYDYAFGSVSSAGGKFFTTTLAMQDAWFLPGSGGSVVVGCDATHELQVINFKLTAVQVGGLTIS